MVWRLSLLSFQVTTNYSLSRQDKWRLSLHQLDLPVYCVIWSPYEIDSMLGTEWMSYFAHKHTRMSGESLPPLQELFIAVFSFLHSQMNPSSGAERLTCLLKDVSLFNHTPNSHPNTCSKPSSISACEGNRIGFFPSKSTKPNKKDYSASL